MYFMKRNLSLALNNSCLSIRKGYSSAPRYLCGSVLWLCGSLTRIKTTPVETNTNIICVRFCLSNTHTHTQTLHYCGIVLFLFYEKFTGDSCFSSINLIRLWKSGFRYEMYNLIVMIINRTAIFTHHRNVI